MQKLKQKKVDTVQIPAMEIEQAEITIIGDSSLICHAWATKAKKQMLDKQMQLPNESQGAKDPEQCFRRVSPDGR